MRNITLNCFWVTAKAVKGMREGLKSTDGKMPHSTKKKNEQKPKQKHNPGIKNGRQ